MRAGLLAVVVVFGSLMTPMTASGETPARWSVRVGYARLSFDTASSIRAAGAEVPGAAIAIDDRDVLLGDVGVALTSRWRASIALGSPVTLAIEPAGSLQQWQPPLGRALGTLQVAPVLATLSYSPGTYGRFAPYAGLGATYAWVRKATSGDLENLRASSEWGVALQAGCDVTLASRWIAFADARKIFVSTTAAGSLAPLGGVPVQAAVELDPLILNVGVGYRF